MVIDMNESQLSTLQQVRDFLVGTADVTFAAAEDDAARYRFISRVLLRFDYPRLGRADKGLIRHYLARTSGYSRAQITRLLQRQTREGGLSQRYRAPRAGFRPQSRHHRCRWITFLVSASSGSAQMASTPATVSDL